MPSKPGAAISIRKAPGTEPPTHILAVQLADGGCLECTEFSYEEDVHWPAGVGQATPVIKDLLIALFPEGTRLPAYGELSVLKDGSEVYIELRAVKTLLPSNKKFLITHIYPSHSADSLQVDWEDM